MAILHNEPIRLGYIGEVKNLKLYRLPKVGEQLTTEVHILSDILDVTLAGVCTKVNGEVIAETRMKLAMTQIEAADNK